MMTPQEKNEIRVLKAQVAELLDWKREREKQQLRLPLDLASVQVLSEALRGNVLDRINVRDIFFQATQESPTEEGQMRYFNNRITQNYRMTTTKGVFTGTINLTAV
jgi:hypothetical protein